MLYVYAKLYYVLFCTFFYVFLIHGGGSMALVCCKNVLAAS